MTAMIERVLVAVAMCIVGCQFGASAPPTDEELSEAPHVVEQEQVRRELAATDRIEVPTEGFPSAGPESAPVTLVYATSFTCPFCARSRVTLKQLQHEYGERLRVVTRLRLIGSEPLPPALAACAADRQGKFHEYADLVWDKAVLDGDFSQTHLSALALEAGLDVERFSADSAGDECADAVALGDESLVELGLRGAPTWVINGRVVVGAKPIEEFRAIIDEELARLEQG